jgi:hypothetical protein
MAWSEYLDVIFNVDGPDYIGIAANAEGRDYIAEIFGDGGEWRPLPGSYPADWLRTELLPMAGANEAKTDAVTFAKKVSRLGGDVLVVADVEGEWVELFTTSLHVTDKGEADMNEYDIPYCFICGSKEPLGPDGASDELEVYGVGGGSVDWTHRSCAEKMHARDAEREHQELLQYFAGNHEFRQGSNGAIWAEMMKEEVEADPSLLLPENRAKFDDVLQEIKNSTRIRIAIPLKELEREIALLEHQQRGRVKIH